jgi:hypothetical protein
MYAYVIGTSHTLKKINVLKVKGVEKIICSNGVHSQMDE